jgi:amino-acid N-acetyltransferase
VSQPDSPVSLRGGAAITRPAAIADVPEIYYLLEAYSSQGNLLPRTMSELYRHVRDFFVVVLDKRIAACGALEIFTEDLGEIRSLAVADNCKGRGFAKMLVTEVIAEANRLGLRRLMALTYTPEFFYKLGFTRVAKGALPEKVWGVCVKCYKFNACDETAVLLELGNPLVHARANHE